VSQWGDEPLPEGEETTFYRGGGLVLHIYALHSLMLKRLYAAFSQK